MYHCQFCSLKLSLIKSHDGYFGNFLLGNTYCIIGDFDFEGYSDPVQTDPRMVDINVKRIADEFVDMIRSRTSVYRTNEILYTFGCDFEFSNAYINFKNMDKLIQYVNQHQEYNITMFYSTPSIYTEALNKKNITWSLKTDDFFPYAVQPV